LTDELLILTSEIVSAHVSHNAVGATELPELIRTTFQALHTLGQPVAPHAAAPVPAVSIRASIKPDYLVCLEDGKKLTMLKRYLRTTYGLSPDDYRAKWGLPRDYPMVAPNYAEKRRALAHSIGLGRKVANTANAVETAVTGVVDSVLAVAEPVVAVVKKGRKTLGIAAAKAAAAAHLGAGESAPAVQRGPGRPRTSKAS
jgi:predicted transcriptional regulator